MAIDKHKMRLWWLQNDILVDTSKYRKIYYNYSDGNINFALWNMTFVWLHIGFYLVYYRKFYG